MNLATMTLFACYGLSHKTAPLILREKATFTQKDAGNALNHLIKKDPIQEAVLISTCNRTEIYAVLKDRHLHTLPNWLAQQRSLNANEVLTHCYGYQQADAVKHLIRVLCGLDSMELGESRIRQQVKKAYQLAQSQNAVGSYLSRLFENAFSAAKTIRHQTQLNQQSTSLVYTGLCLAKEIFSNIENSSALVIGTGKMATLAAAHLRSQSTQNLFIASRTYQYANNLAKRFQGHPLLFCDIPKYLSQVDIVFSATETELPLLGKGMVERILKQRKCRPILILDFGVPRNIEPEISALEHIYLYNIDDLGKMIAINRDLKQKASQAAESLIPLTVQDCMRQIHIHHQSKFIQTYRQNAESHRDQEIAKALEDLKDKTCSTEVVLQQLAHRLTNKLLHLPTMLIKDEALY